MDNRYYWENKKGRAKIADIHTKIMKEKYGKEIHESAIKSIFYSFESKFPLDNVNQINEEMDIKLVNLDSVSAIMNYAEGKTAVLNFASYKEPGGGFMIGSRAQEESLCHESFLYNVLKRFQFYYDWNNEHKNKGMYLDRAIYTPNVLFERENSIEHCDVITCAAPNYSVGKKYGSITPKQNSEALDSRIKFVLDIAADNNVDTLILGAYGCGVFSQDAEEVMNIFKKYLETSHKRFNKVIFAIPDNVHGENYTKACKVFG